VTSQEMGFGKVSRDEIAMSFLDVVFLSHKFNASSTTHISGLQDVKIFKIIKFPFLLPSLIILREHVSWGTNLEFFPVSPPLSLHIPPHIGFASKSPSSWKMVDFLQLVKILQLGRSVERGPKTVPRGRPCARSNEMESSCFEGIYDTVIDMSNSNPEC
jgi:hypothetical protein